MTKKAFVSGCFDMLHSGHVAFFQEAAKYGDLYVAIGSDANIFNLKNRPTVNNQAERLYMIKSLSYVKEVFVAKGWGILDFVEELKEIKPDVFVVNEDGSTPEKKKLCAELGIEYVILKREPHTGLAARSTTALRSFSTIPDWIDLAGGVFSLPDVSTRAPGAAITISVHPLEGATSIIRAAAVDLWGARMPADKPEKLAKILFGYTNLPGAKELRSSVESIGITFAGVTRADYSGGYWPVNISPLQDENSLQFIEDSLYVIPLASKPLETGQPKNQGLGFESVQTLGRASEACWQAIIQKDLIAFGRSLQESSDVEFGVSPNMLSIQAKELMEPFREQILGWKICDMGSHAYLLLVSSKPIRNVSRISIRRASD